MLLRKAYANTLRFLRGRTGSTQLELARDLDASYVSRLERGDSAITIEASESLSRALGISPLALLALAHSAQDGSSARAKLESALEELSRLELLDVQIPNDLPGPLHPLLAKGMETTKAVLALKAEGLSQAEVARTLGISTSTVGRHWRR